jgi:enoyl-CoA hydratase
MAATSVLHEGTLVITFDRPPVNAFDHPAVQEMEAVFAAAAAAAPRGGVVITGAGKTFSAGVDVKAYRSYAPARRHDMALAITRGVAALLSIPCPVVAAVNGHALGGGFVLMLGADLRVLNDDPSLKFGIPEAAQGVPFPAATSAICAAELPAPLWRRLGLTGETISSGELLAHGVVDTLAPGDQVLSVAVERARQTAAQAVFNVVKRQVRGQLIESAQAMARDGYEPFLDAFSRD